MIEPWVMMNVHHAYEYPYLVRTADATESRRLGLVSRLVPRAELDQTVEAVAQQIAQAPLSVLMGVKAGVKRAWEGMGMRVHRQCHLEMIQMVGRAGDVADWWAENEDRGYGAVPRQVMARRAAAAEAQARSNLDRP